MKSVTWIWLRHLRVADADGRFCGSLDPSASFTGTREAQALAAALPADALLVTSPLARCRATLAAVAAAGGPQAEAVTEAAFAEQSFGDWEGRRYADVPEIATWSIEDYALRAPPGGESFAALCERVAATIERRNAVADGRPLLVCSHAGVVRAALAHALDLPPAKALAFAVDCGSITRITCIGPADRRVEQVNVRP